MTAENNYRFSGSETSSSSSSSSSENHEEDLRVREESWLDEFDGLNQNEPDPLAPIADQIAHALAMTRLREQAEKIQSEKQAS